MLRYNIYTKISLSLSLKVLSTLESYQYKMIYVCTVCLYLRCLPVAGSRPIFQLANICLTNTQTRNETQFLIICSVVVVTLLVLPLLSFVGFFSVVFVLFVALEKLDFWASRCQAAVLFYTLYKWKVEDLVELSLRTFWFNFKNV